MNHSKESFYVMHLQNRVSFHFMLTLSYTFTGFDSRKLLSKTYFFMSLQTTMSISDPGSITGVGKG